MRFFFFKPTFWEQALLLVLCTHVVLFPQIFSHSFLLFWEFSLQGVMIIVERDCAWVLAVCSFLLFPALSCELLLPWSSWTVISFSQLMDSIGSAWIPFPLTLARKFFSKLEQSKVHLISLLSVRNDFI